MQDVKAQIEKTGKEETYDVVQAYRVNGTMVEFVPDDRVDGHRYYIVVDGEGTNQWVSKKAGRPSKKLAVFFYEKLHNGRYVRNVR